jgi:hypothetical protein
MSCPGQGLVSELREVGVQRTLEAVSCLPCLDVVLFIAIPTLDYLADAIKTADTGV